MDYILQNDKLQAKIVSKGAELKSLVHKRSGREVMWQADPKYWGRTAPVLFPQVGKVIDDTYTYEGAKFHLPQHGFARDQEFTPVSQTETELWLKLQDNDATKEAYPFAFKLELGYRLEDSELRAFWRVTNLDEKEMYFSIGGHPAFCCPIQGEESFEGYYLNFHTDKKELTNLKFGTGYVSNETEQISLEEDGTLRMTQELFAHDALVIEHHQTQAVSLMTPEKRAYLTVRFDAPLFGIWSPPGKNAPFVCIEPWYGRADKEGFTGSLQEREWEQSLKAGEIFEVSYSIQPEDA